MNRGGFIKKQSSLTKLIEIVLIGSTIIIIIYIVLTLILGLLVILLTHNSPYITAPFETSNVEWTVFEYKYADDEFNQCINDSLNVYDIGECYQSKNEQLLDKRFNGIDIPTATTVNLYFDKDNNLNYFSIVSPSYFLNLDAFETQYQSIFFLIQRENI